MNKTKVNEALNSGIEAHKAGNIKEADRYYTSILNIWPKHPDANHNMGVLAITVGKLEQSLSFFKIAIETSPNIAQYWLSYVNALLKLERHDEALKAITQAKEIGQIDLKLENYSSKKKSNKTDKHFADPPDEEKSCLLNLFDKRKFREVNRKSLILLQKYPSSSFLFHLLGVINTELKQYKDAIYNLQKALELKPNYADAHNNLGNVFQATKRTKEAIESYKKALDIKFDFAEAYFNLGNAFKEIGNNDLAIKNYKYAIKYRPNYPEAYNNLGTLLHQLGNLKEAIQNFETAINLDHYFYMAHNNMGVSLMGLGNQSDALKCFVASQKINPNYMSVYQNIADAIKNTRFVKPCPELMPILVNCLERNNLIRPKDISHAVISLLKFEVGVSRAIREQKAGILQASFKETIKSLQALPLFLKLLKVCPIPDKEIENVLMELRSNILSCLVSQVEMPNFSNFLSALAQQCFTNEYIYIQSEEEQSNLNFLQAEVENSIKDGKIPSTQDILCLASYKPLNEFKWSDALSESIEITEVFEIQVSAFRLEEKLRPKIRSLNSINDKISKKVQSQYEEYPYPRWINLALPRYSRTIDEFVINKGLRLSSNDILNIKCPEILIAGCGTGQQSITTSQFFKDCSVLAVDLSFSSLAYAKRKTNEFEINNISYMQADLLDLGKLDKQFDIIECTGVLHHMNDPLIGWKALVDCLKPNGLMKIGLYSTVARTHIKKMREEIKRADLGKSTLAMKEFRHAIISSNKKHHKLITESSDFYSTSSLKDLLFHVKEHTFTALEIENSLDQLGLFFCGMDNQRTISDFKLVFNSEEDRYNLTRWHLFENKYKRAFAGMFEFWCQKIITV